MRLPEHPFYRLIRMVLTFNPPCRAFGLSRQRGSGEDCLNEVSSAAAQMRR